MTAKVGTLQDVVVAKCTSGNGSRTLQLPQCKYPSYSPILPERLQYPILQIDLKHDVGNSLGLFI